jgi:3-methylcrotonyl-CoA carboxylase alpha subunit
VTLANRRFGGDYHERAITLRLEDETAQPITVHLKSLGPSSYAVKVLGGSGTDVLTAQAARLVSPNVLEVTINGELLRSTIVSQQPPPSLPVSEAPHTQERLHIFQAGQKTTLVLPAPQWLLSLGSDVIKAGQAKGALKAPMPSLVVEVKVSVGDRVNAGDPVVILESMKTETVLRAPKAGVVKAVGCDKGEMVEEGRELVDIAADDG